ncbi:MAG: 3-deoxy-D-manno-octulosonic acid transferase [Acidobacteria bacterium]|nr:3-deoxy-D-manno-octulosonic acid transferase [Acidobacteriota bacterium]MCL5289330.1 3-deoxy-D-manno-octulosonic acid transferase [Acidobacteriota bacterium]
MYLLYSLLTAIGMILLLPYFLVRGLGSGKYFHNLGERLGALPCAILSKASGARGSIWIHAVSVGEVLAGLPLARAIKERFPERKLFVSTTTRTGQDLARERMTFADGIFYFPLDWAFSVRRVMRVLQPRLIVILETEIWPNFLREARRASVPVVFVNGRISKQSFKRFSMLTGIFGEFLRGALNDAALFLMQSEKDAERVRKLGAAEERVEVTGNLKYDFAPPNTSAIGDWLAKQIAEQERWPVVVAGSVVEDEEEPVLAAFDIVERAWRRALLVLAPRKPERFDAAARIAEERGWKVVRRSRLSLDAPLDEEADLLLLDTVGELAGLYRFADAVFVGGSLVARGGHNILEPAAFARAPVFGPHMENFSEMAADFLAARAAVHVADARELGEAWAELIRGEEKRRRMGEAAKALVESNRGATAKSLERIAAILAAKRGGE